MLKWLLGIPPELGSRWKQCGDRNPYSKYIEVVVDIKEGWVRLRDRNGLYSELSIRNFRNYYREIV